MIDYQNYKAGRRVSQKNLFFIFSLFLFILTVIFILALGSDYFTTYMLVLVFFAVTAIPFIIAYSKNSFDLFEVIYPIAFLYFLYFGLRTIYVLNTSDERAVTFFFVYEIVDRALIYTILGFAALLLGYYSKLPYRIVNRLPLINYNPSKKRTFQAMIVLYSIGMFSRIFFFIIGRTLDAPSIYNLIDYPFIFCQWVLIFVLINHYSAERKDKMTSFFLWLVLIPAEIILTALLRPARGYFLPVFIAPFMTYHYIKNKIRISHLLIPALLMYFMIFPIIPPMKSLAFQGFTPKFDTFFTDVERMYSAVAEHLGSMSFSGYLENSYDEFLNRFHGIDILTTVIAYTPEAIDFQYGRTIFAIFGFLVPKALRESTFLEFLDTDILTLGRRLGIIYYGVPDEAAAAGVAITQIGELYLNFHVFGIIAGMFLLGIFYRAFYLYLIKKNTHPFSLLIYITLWFIVMMPELWFVDAYSNVLKKTIILLLICWYLNGGKLFIRGFPRSFKIFRRGG